MIFTIYKKQMTKYGESYASAFYLTAALILALCGAGLHKFYDTAAGLVFLSSDIAILILQFKNKLPRFRAILLFGGSFIGSLILLSGSVFDELHDFVTDFELFGAIARLLSNIILVFASFCGLMTLFPSIKTRLPSRPGTYYIISYAFFLVFAAAQFYLQPSIMSFGYILAVLLWLLASNAIRLKFDEGTKPALRD